MATVRNEAELRATLEETPTTPPEDVTNYLKTRFRNFNKGA